jgi:hypothetical protein
MDRTAKPGRPGTAGAWVGGAPGGAAPALGARGALPREAGTLIPPQGCPLVPWRLPPLHRLARFARDWQTSDALRRENAKVWLFESMKSEFEARRFLNLAPLFRGERSARSAG